MHKELHKDTVMEPIGNGISGECSYPNGHHVEEITFLNCTDISKASV